MANAKPAQPDQPPKPANFEQAIQRLEEIVRLLEGNELSLEESMTAFEEGVALGKFCDERLTEAEKKVELLVKNGDGGAQWQDFPEAPQR